MSFEEEYILLTPHSRRVFERASRSLPGGSSSGARTADFGWRPYPPAIRSGLGSKVEDVDGRRYIDYLLGLGPMILGHRHPSITAAVTEAIAELGTCFAIPTEIEMVAAEKVIQAVPSVASLRFVNSGGEAVAVGIRLARAYTGRRLVVRFEGNYHGGQDTIYWSQHPDPDLAGSPQRPVPVPSGPGLPSELADTLVVLSWNDPESFSSLMSERGSEVAAVITEPVVCNTGCILPQPGYLELLRDECTKHGALLIFDEVITGFRFSRGGAQEWFGIAPDLTTLAKGLGGGFPAAALGGRAEVMALMSDRGFSHGGTYNGNIVASAAVSATMDVLAEPGLYERQRKLGFRLLEGIAQLGEGLGLPVRVEGLGTVAQVWFADRPIRNWREAAAYTDQDLYREWYQEMFLRGILFHPNTFENIFVSLVHSEEDVDATLNAAEDSFRTIAGRRNRAVRRLQPIESD